MVTSGKDVTEITNNGTGGATYDFDANKTGVIDVVSSGAARFSNVSGEFISAANTNIPLDAFSVRAKIKSNDYTVGHDQTIIGAQSAGSSGTTFNFVLDATGDLLLVLSSNGTTTVLSTSTASAGGVDGDEMYVRVDRDGADITFYTAPVPFTSWTQLGSVVTTTVTGTLFTPTAPLMVGAIFTGGTVSKFEGEISEIFIYSDLTETSLEYYLAPIEGNLDDNTWTSSGPNTETWTREGTLPINPMDFDIHHGRAAHLESSSETAIADPLTVIAVVKPMYRGSVPAGNHHYYDTKSSTSAEFAMFLNSSGYGNWRGGGVITASPGTYVEGVSIIQMEAPVSGSTTVTVDGAQAGSVTAASGNESPGFGQLYRQRANEGNDTFDGFVLEMLFWDSALDSNDIAEVVAFLDNKWRDTPYPTPTPTVTPTVTPTITPSEA